MFQDISEVMFVCLYVFLGMLIVLRVKQRLELESLFDTQHYQHTQKYIQAHEHDF